MNIEKGSVVSIEYTLKDDGGNVLDSSKGQDNLVYLHGHGNLVPGLEKALEGKKAGDDVKVSLPPEEGYGPYRDELKGTVKRSELSSIPDLQVGMQLQTKTPNGVQVLNVMAINGDDVELDANHPLAGKTLHFEVKIAEVRKATEDELSHGHVHGKGGHHH